MKSIAVASIILAAAAVAQPHGHQHQLRHHHAQHHDKRAIVTEVQWVTETQYVTKLVDSTTTVWVSSGHEAPTHTSEEAKFIESKATTKSTTSTSIYTPPPPPTTTTSSTSVAPPPPPPTTSTTSTYVPPPPPPPPKTTTAPPPAPAKKKPVQQTVEQPPPAQTSAPSNSGGSGGGGGSFTGDITFYDLGLSACGTQDGGKDLTTNIVALPKGMMGGDGPTYSDNPNCGRTITIKANGKTTTALVTDKCMGCDGGSIDVSKKAFEELFGSLDVGRSTCEWSFN